MKVTHLLGVAAVVVLGCNNGPGEGNTNVDSTITLQAGPKNPGDSTEPQGLVNLPLLQVRATVTVDQPEVLKSLTVGLQGSNDALESVTLYVDAADDGVVGPEDTKLRDMSPPFSDNSVTFGDLTQSLPVGNTSLLLVGTIKADATPGTSVVATISAGTALVGATASGATVAGRLQGGAAITGGRKTVGAPSAVLVAVGAQTPSASTTTLTQINLPVLQVDASLPSSSAESAKVTSLTISSTGTANEAVALARLRLYRDVNGNGVVDVQQDQLIGTVDSVATDNGDAVFQGLSEVLPAGSTISFLVVADLSGNGSTGQTLVFGVPNNGLAAVGGRSTRALSTSGTPLTGNAKTLDSGKGLFVAAGLMNPSFSTEAVGATNVSMLQLTLRASVGQPVRVNQLTLRASGFGDDQAAYTGVRLYVDANGNGVAEAADTQLGTSVTVNGNDGTATFTALNTVIPSGATQTWLVVADFSTSVVPTESYALGFPSNENLGVVDPSSNVALQVSGAPIFGGLKTISSQGSLGIAVGVNSPGTSNESASATGVPMLQFSLNASSVEGVRVTSVTVRASGTADDSASVGGVRLYRDANENGLVDAPAETALATTQTYASDNGTVVFNNLNELIAAGGRAVFLVTYDFNGTALPGQTFGAAIALSTAIAARGSSSNAAIAPTGTATGSLKTMQAQGSLTLAAGTNNPGNSSQIATAANIPALQFSLTASSVEQVRVTAVTVRGGGTGNDATGVSAVSLHRDVNGDGQLDSGDVTLGTPQVFNADNGTATFSGLMETILPGARVNYLVTLTLSASPTPGQTFSAAIATSSAVTASGLSSNGNIIPGGTAGGPTITVQGGGLTLSTGLANPGATTELSNASDVAMLQLRLAAGVGDGVRVTSVTLNAGGNTDDTTSIAGVRLFRDVDGNGRVSAGDVAIAGPATYNADNGILTFTGLSEVIPASGSVLWVIQYALSGTGTAGQTFDVRVASNAAVVAEGQSTGQAATVTGAGITSSTKTIRAPALALALGANTPTSSSEAPNATGVPMLQFRVTGDAIDTVVISGITVTAAGAIADQTDVTEVRLYADVDASGDVSAGDLLLGSPRTFTADNGTAFFSGLSRVVAPGTSQSLLVVYDLSGTAAAGGSFDARIAATTSVLAASQSSGQPAAITGPTPVVGNPKTVATQFNTWSATTRSGAPRARSNHTAVVNGATMIVFGGEDQSGELGDGATYTPATNSWSALPTLNAPSARTGHVAAVAGGYMVVFGGKAGSTYLNSGARLNLSTNQWQAMSTTNAPSARANATIVSTGTGAGGTVIVWGGYNGAALDTGAIYNPATDTWTAIGGTGTPAARYLHSAVWTGTEMIIFGGFDGTYLSDGARYTPGGNWTATSAGSNGNLGTAASHAAVWTGTEMIIFGGFRGTASTNVSAAYTPGTDTWRALATLGAPAARGLPVAVYTGTRLVVWGGYSGTAALDTGGQIDPVFNQWSPTSANGAPVSRYGHTGVWVGGRFVVWGGQNLSSYLDTGGRYIP